MVFLRKQDNTVKHRSPWQKIKFAGACLGITDPNSAAFSLCFFLIKSRPANSQRSQIGPLFTEEVIENIPQHHLVTCYLICWAFNSFKRERDSFLTFIHNQKCVLLFTPIGTFVFSSWFDCIICICIQILITSNQHLNQSQSFNIIRATIKNSTFVYKSLFW